MSGGSRLRGALHCLANTLVVFLAVCLWCFSRFSFRTRVPTSTAEARRRNVGSDVGPADTQTLKSAALKGPERHISMANRPKRQLLTVLSLRCCCETWRR